MKTAIELKEKARHIIDTPGHPDYGKTIFTFNDDELEEYVEKLRAEGLDKLMFDFFKGSGFERLAEAQQREAAKQQVIYHKKQIRENYEYFKWRKENNMPLSEAQLREYEYCIYKIEVESKVN
jgi:MoaA/NifB/PqqE/SkfB family radical SAM enzyme